MSHEICKSISRPRQTEDGKWIATLYSAVNNISPLSYRKVNYMPQESREKLIAVILHDIYFGNVHMTGKSSYKTFLDEVRWGVVKSPALESIDHYSNIRDWVWNIYYNHKHWHNAEKGVAEKMTEKRERICAKCDKKTEEAEMRLAQEFIAWKPDQRKYYVEIDGQRIMMYRKSKRKMMWRYAPKGHNGKEFTGVAAKSIERVLGKVRRVNVIEVKRDDALERQSA